MCIKHLHCSNAKGDGNSTIIKLLLSMDFPVALLSVLALSSNGPVCLVLRELTVSQYDPFRGGNCEDTDNIPKLTNIPTN